MRSSRATRSLCLMRCTVGRCTLGGYPIGMPFTSTFTDDSIMIPSALMLISWLPFSTRAKWVMAPSCSSLCPAQALQLIPFVTASIVVTCSNESHAVMQCCSYSKNLQC